MSYVQGFVIPVPTANKEAYRELATSVAPLFFDYGTQRIVECWGDAVPRGSNTDFFRAVNAEDDENVVFSWIIWESKEFCDQAMEKMTADERMAEPPNNPFDGKRMIYGGFETLSAINRASAAIGYVQGYVAPVPTDNKSAFEAMAATMGEIATDHGALAAFDCWGTDISDGEVTDLKRAVKASPDETVVFGFTAWPSKAAHSAAMPNLQSDDRMPKPGSEMPLDGSRLIFGGFEVLMDGRPSG